VATPRQIAERQIKAAFAGDWDALRALYADDVQYTDPDGELRGVDAAIAHLKEQVVPLSDISVEVDRIYAGEDFAVAEWSAKMQYNGEVTAGKPTPMTLSVTTIYDIRGDRIVSERNYYDLLSTMTQLGVFPPSP
jgi:limonene-1,2-epoxide hydrolase